MTRRVFIEDADGSLFESAVEAFREDPVKAADVLRRHNLLAGWLLDRCYKYTLDAIGRVAWIRVPPGEAADLDAAVAHYLHGDV
jgi:hypothetical protein